MTRPVTSYAVPATKLHLPRPRRALVTRDRLTARLPGRGDPRPRLVLVAAPAGFGKTTLVTQWLAADPPATVGWLSLDAGDDDLRRFLTLLVAAVRAASPAGSGLGDDAATLLDTDRGVPADEVVVSLLDDLDTLPGPTVLVLDDYHVLTTTAVHDAVGFLLDNLPPQVTVTMTTRADPPLPLSRLRARGELLDVRAADLRFTEPEATAFLNDVMGLGLPPQQVAALETRTEGWAAGLQLAALSVGSAPDPGADVGQLIDGFAGSHRLVLDYLLEEVLDRLPADVRTFLLDTSVLDELTAPLCDALTGRADGQEALEGLERANLFVVPLDDERRWWRYHHLFADALRSRAAAHDPDRVRRLHRAAACWYAGQDRLTDAYPHALAADDPKLAADVLELALPGLRARREDRTMRDWVRTVPDEVRRRRPLLATTYAWTRLAEGDLDGVETWLDVAGAGLDEAPAAALSAPATPAAVRTWEADVAALPAMVAVYRASVAQARGDVGATVAQAQRALDLAGPDDHFPRGAAAGFLGLAAWASGDLAIAVTTFTEAVTSLAAAGNRADELGATVVLALMWLARGRPDEARRLLERALADAEQHTGPPLTTVGDLHVALADVLREQGDLVAAEQHLRTAEALGERASLPENRHRWWTARAWLRRARGDLDGAVADLDVAEPLFLPGYFPDVRPVAAQRVRVLLARGEPAAPRDWVAGHAAALDEPVSYLAEYDALTLARVLVAEPRVAGDGGPDRVERAVEAVLRAAEPSGRAGSTLDALVVRALCRSASGDRPAALDDVARALVLGVPVGYRRIYLDEGEPMAALLRDVAASGAGEAARLAADLLEAGERPQQGAQPGPASPAGDALSERELEVLRLLATELTGPEIAQRLYVSINTFRTHTKSIFTKLGVNTRRAAVLRAQEQHLV